MCKYRLFATTLKYETKLTTEPNLYSNSNHFPALHSDACCVFFFDARFVACFFYPWFVVCHSSIGAAIPRPAACGTRARPRVSAERARRSRARWPAPQRGNEATRAVAQARQIRFPAASTPTARADDAVPFAGAGGCLPPADGVPAADACLPAVRDEDPRKERGQESLALKSALAAGVWFRRLPFSAAPYGQSACLQELIVTYAARTYVSTQPAAQYVSTLPAAQYVSTQPEAQYQYSSPQYSYGAPQYQYAQQAYAPAQQTQTFTLPADAYPGKNYEFQARAGRPAGREGARAASARARPARSSEVCACRSLRSIV